MHTAVTNTPEFTGPAASFVRCLACCRYMIAKVWRNGKNTAAYSTCTPRMYQYDQSKLHRSLHWNLGPASVVAAPVRFESMIRNSTAATTPTPAMTAPSTSGGCQPASYSGFANFVDRSTEAEPTRARLRNSAIASATSRRENHCATPATSEMKIAPSLTPNTSRPTHMSWYGSPTAVSTAPTNPISAAHSVTCAAPKR